MHSSRRSIILATGGSIALSIYQFIILADMLERLARLLPGMKGMASMGLIIAATLAELAFIYTLYPGYKKRQGAIPRRFLVLTLMQAYLLVLFVPLRVVLLGRAFGLATNLEVFLAAGPTDYAIFTVALLASAVCLAFLSLAPKELEMPSFKS